MMKALVGYGVSSDSSDSEKQEPRECFQETERSVKSRNLLLEAESGSSSSSSSECDPGPEASAGPAPRPLTHKLPPPRLDGGSISGVFVNPFRDAAEEQLTLLQKHVPLTHPPHPASTRLCVAYRRHARCRFGTSCRYAHDSDLQSPPPTATTDTPPARLTRPEREPGRKRRAGLSDSLVPPKRALKQHARLAHT